MNPDRHPGPIRGIPASSTSFFVRGRPPADVRNGAVAAKLNGGNEDNYLPRIEALKRLKPNVVRWSTNSNEVEGLLGRGEAMLAAGLQAFAHTRDRCRPTSKVVI